MTNQKSCIPATWTKGTVCKGCVFVRDAIRECSGGKIAAQIWAFYLRPWWAELPAMPVLPCSDCFHKWCDLFFLWLLCKYHFIPGCFPVRPAAPKWRLLEQGVSPRCWCSLTRAAGSSQTTHFPYISLLDHSFSAAWNLYFSHVESTWACPWAQQSPPPFRAGKRCFRTKPRKSSLWKKLQKNSFFFPPLILPSSPWVLLLTQIFPSTFSALFSWSQGSSWLFGIYMPLR